MLQAFLFICILFTLLYIFLIIYFYVFWENIPKPNIKTKEQLFFSVIIPFRNESEHIERLIQSLNLQDYPTEKYEVIFVDDFSDDNTLKLLSPSLMDHHQVIDLDNEVGFNEYQSNKKAGINLAISRAKGTHIITLDADCVCKPKWLKVINKALQSTSSRIMTGPVLIRKPKSLLAYFQSSDVLASMGVTGAGNESKICYLANGANLVFEKNLFEELGGYKGNENIASGDDVFLFHKAIKADVKTGFIKSADAVVLTPAEKTLKAFRNQRIRWSTKSRYFSHFGTLFVAGFVFTFNIVLLINFFLGLFFSNIVLQIFLIQFFLKILFDFIFLQKVAKNLKYKMNPVFFLISSLLFPLYYVWISIVALFNKEYEWKNRKIQVTK